jgi:hypothetical protein
MDESQVNSPIGMYIEMLSLQSIHLANRGYTNALVAIVSSTVAGSLTDRNL